MRNGVTLCLLAFLGGCSFGKPPKPFTDEVVSVRPIAQVKEIRANSVKVLFLNTKAPKAAQTGVELRPGEIVTTDRLGAAQLKFKNGAMGRMALNTQIQLQSVERLKLTYGKVLVWSPKPLQIQTPYGTIASQNSIVYINLSRHPLQASEVVVLRGKATNYSANTKIDIHSGEQLFFWGIPFKKQKLSPQGRKSWSKQNMSLLKFSDRFPTEVTLVKNWQKTPIGRKAPKKYNSPAPYYAPPAPYDPYDGYGYGYEPAPAPYYAPPAARQVSAPAPPPAYVAEPPPPLPNQTEPEPVPIEPVATETIIPFEREE